MHTDRPAGESARSIQAHAYAAGVHVVFGPEEYAPETDSGRHLIAHELAHVVQQERTDLALHRKFFGFFETDNLGDDPSPDDLYHRYFSFVQSIGVDGCAEALAKRLHVYLAIHPNPYDFIRKLFDIIPSSYEDNVASNFVSQLGELELARFAANDPDHATLHILYEAMMTGDVSGFEREQAARLEQFFNRGSSPYQAFWSVLGLANHESALSSVEAFSNDVIRRGLEPAVERLVPKLRAYVDDHPDPYTYLLEVFARLPDALADNVAAEFLASMDNATLERLGRPAAAQNLLNKLYEALITGNVSGFERFEAERVIQIKTGRVPFADYEAYQQQRRVFPIKYQEFLRFTYAAPNGELLGDGQIRIWYPSERVYDDEFREDLKTLGGSARQLTGEGIVLGADEIVSVRLYDEDEKELPIPAIKLLDYANESKNRSLSLGGQAFLAGLTLPLGGAAETAFGRALLIADRVAWGLSLVSSLINDNREWIASYEGGQAFLDAVDSVNRMAGYYGWARLGGDALHAAAGKLGPAWRDWHAEPKPGLTPDQAGIVNDLDQQVGSIVSDLEDADKAAHASDTGTEKSADNQPADSGPEATPDGPILVKPTEPVDPRVSDRAAKASEDAGKLREKLAEATKAWEIAKRGGSSKMGAVLPLVPVLFLHAVGSLGYRFAAMVYYFAKTRAATSFTAFIERLEEDGILEWAKLGQQEQAAIEQTFNQAMHMGQTGDLAYGGPIFSRLSKKAKSIFSEERIDVMAAQGKALGKTDDEIIAAIEAEVPARAEQAVIQHQDTPLGGGRYLLDSEGIVGEPHFARLGVEKKYPLGKDVGLPGYVRYHVEGIGAVGDELNIVYAPERFNISETAEVENRIREIRANAKGELNYHFRVTYRVHNTYSSYVQHTVTIKVLESITWELEERALGSDDFKLLFTRTETL